ncbi:MAG: LEA type 2 family protein [Betaproteobacteria bacterium]|nr:LEA type 2 family protein [Betaproteobacteria bacterium]
MVAALLLAACATMLPGIPPRIDVVGVSLDRIVGSDAYFSVAVSISNPGERDVVIESLEGTLSIEGQEVAKGDLKAPVDVPAHGSASAEFSARTGMDAVLLAVAKAMQRGARTRPSAVPPSLHYLIEGRAKLAGGASLPFSRSGDVGESR